MLCAVTEREFAPVAVKIPITVIVAEAQNYHRNDNCKLLRMTRILLVEDSEDVLYLLRLQLEWMGYVVDAVSNATAALEAASRIRPDVIVSDLGMPDMDGFELIRQIRKHRDLSSVPAIALTGASTDTDIQRAISSGFTAHLTKPIDAADLSGKIEQLTVRSIQRKAG